MKKKAADVVIVKGAGGGKGNAEDAGNTDNDYASQKTESKTTETIAEPKIIEMRTITQPDEKSLEGICVSITKIETKSFVPLGIRNTRKESDISFDKIEIKYEIKNKPAKECYVKVFAKHPTPGVQLLLWEGPVVKTGHSMKEHSHTWDGFDTHEKYNSQNMLNGLIFEITAKSADGEESTDKKEITVEQKVKWLGVLIDRKRKEIHVSLRIKFKNGGARGLKKTIPEAKWVDGKKPLDERTKTFNELKELAKEGLSYHWGRNNRHEVEEARFVEIAGERYEVYVSVDAIDDPIYDIKKMYMNDIKLVFNTNKRSMRSRNLGKVVPPISTLVKIFAHARVVYHEGYLRQPGDWDRWDESLAVADFKYTAAHEIGHEILQAFGNAIYSYKHKGTSTLSQKPKKGAPWYPAKNEIKELDVMKYYRGDKYFNYFKMYVVTEEDLSGLIWLIKVGIK
jgi:hypothetical protein